jgi:DNA-directed RNA polymerase subunit RPC12/RpoP
MAVSFKCPGCSASLIFDADKQMMTCEFCGKVIALEDVDKLSPVLSEEALGKEAVRDAEIRDAKLKDTSAADTVSAAAAMAQAAEPPKWDEESMQYVCNGCGATVITDKNTAATFCAFCGSPTIIAERLVQDRTPEYVLPFQFGREAAINCFFEWCKAGRLTPIQFVKKENVEKMTGMYVPFWLFDGEVDMNYGAVGRKVSATTTGRTTYTTTSYFDVVRKRHLDWNNIPLDGATRIDDKLMEIIEPYEYRDLCAFDMKYLAGFFADKYDIAPDKLTGRLKNRLTTYVSRIWKESVSGYTSVSKVSDTSVYFDPQFHYALMPIWLLNYKYLGKTYTFAMNGQTGKVAGEPPVSVVKLTILGLAVLPVAAIICKLLSFAILGGSLT